jgi:methyl-accepting chemotaxis protein
MNWKFQTFAREFAMNNLKIGTRLGVGFSLILLLLVAMTAIGILRLSSASTKTDEMINVKIRDERMIAEWGKIIEVNAARTTGAFMVRDPADQKKLEALMAESSGRATQIQDQIGANLDDEELKPVFKQVLDTRKAYTDFRKAVFTAKNAGDLETATKIYEGDMTQSRIRYLAALKAFADKQAAAGRHRHRHPEAVPERPHLAGDARPGGDRAGRDCRMVDHAHHHAADQ